MFATRSFDVKLFLAQVSVFIIQYTESSKIKAVNNGPEPGIKTGFRHISVEGWGSGHRLQGSGIFEKTLVSGQGAVKVVGVSTDGHIRLNGQHPIAHRPSPARKLKGVLAHGHCKVRSPVHGALWRIPVKPLVYGQGEGLCVCVCGGGGWARGRDRISSV